MTNPLVSGNENAVEQVASKGRRRRSSRRGVRRPEDRTLPRPEDRTLQAGRWLLAAALLFSALALGAIHTTILGITAVLVAASAFCVWFRATPVPPRVAGNVLLATGVGLTLFTLWQSLPMPAGLLHLIAPSNADVWSRALLPLHLPGPRIIPLSLDPGATRVEVLRGAVYLAAFACAMRLSVRRENGFFCMVAIASSAIIVGLAALLHPALGAERVFGVYRPTTLIASRHIAPILNSNALAAYVNIGFFIALGEGFAPKPTAPRSVSLAGAAVLMAIQLWLASRGGVLTLLAGTALVVWITAIGRRAHHHNLTRVTYMLITVVVTAAVAMWVLASSDEAWTELSDNSTTKLRVFEYVFQLVRKFPLFGVGRGAFESAFPAFRGGTGYLVYTHPENLLLQWGSEWGMPVTIAALSAIAWVLRPSVLLARSRPYVGAWVAIVTSFLHNLVDLNSEFPAVMLAISVCAGLVVGGSGVGKFQGIDAWAKYPRRVAGVIAGGVAVALLLVVPNWDHDLYTDRSTMHDAALQPAEQPEFHELAQSLMLRHPAEPYLPFAGALRASITRDESLVPWAGRTLELAPVYAPVHVLLARSFFRFAPAQARMEYRYALEQAPQFAEFIANESTPLVTGVDAALELAPEGGAGLNVLTSLADRLGPRLPATQSMLDEAILIRNPDSPEVIARKARAAVFDVTETPVMPWCDNTERDTCILRAIDTSLRLQEVRPTRCEGFDLEARARAEEGDLERGLGRLESMAERADDPVVCLTAIVHIATKAHHDAEVTDAIDKLARIGCTNDNQCADHILSAGLLEDQRGNPRRALMYYRRARERYPFRDDILALRASSAARLGLHAEALDEFSELSRRHPEQPKWPADAAHERQLLLQGPLQGQGGPLQGLHAP